MTKAEIQNYVESEGLGYAIQFGISAEDFEGKDTVELAEMWEEARQLLDDIEAELQ